jgi:hypothetical protein
MSELQHMNMIDAIQSRLPVNALPQAGASAVNPQRVNPPVEFDGDRLAKLRASWYGLNPPVSVWELLTSKDVSA